MQEVVIYSEGILLAQFLKWANITASGGESKERILNGDVSVNNERERRRGRQLVPGDIVTIDGCSYKIVKGS